MRYLTNNLNWQPNRHAEFRWISHDGTTLESAFAFGGGHIWQYPTNDLRMFGTHTLCIEEARAWIRREPFLSLIDAPGDRSPWETFIEELLGVNVSNCRPEARRLVMNGEDVILRLGSPDPDLLSRPAAVAIPVLRAQPQLLSWHMHVLRPFDRTVLLRRQYEC